MEKTFRTQTRVTAVLGYAELRDLICGAVEAPLTAMTELGGMSATVSWELDAVEETRSSDLEVPLPAPTSPVVPAVTDADTHAGKSLRAMRARPKPRKKPAYDPTMPCPTDGCVYGAHHPGACTSRTTCDTPNCVYERHHRGLCSNDPRG